MNNSDIKYVELLKKIKVIRIIKNISAKEMAHSLKISYRTYLYIEEGKTSLSFQKLIQICEIFNLSIEDLMRLNYDIQ